MTKYVVINAFKDTKDNNYKYNVGDEYPREGKRVNKNRAESLCEMHPVHKKVFLKAVEEPKSTENDKKTTEKVEKSDE